MDPRMMPKGEYNYSDNEPGNVGRANEPGVYFHPGAQKFIETAHIKRPDGSKSYSVDQGKIQGDAFAQMGFRPATDEELKEYEARQADVSAEQRKKDNATTVVMSDSGKR